MIGLARRDRLAITNYWMQIDEDNYTIIVDGEVDRYHDHLNACVCIKLLKLL
jgi:hypothetical protein